MTFKNDMHLVFIFVQKGLSTAVVEAISDSVCGDSQIFRGSNIPSEQKSLLGITLKEENELIISIVETVNLDYVLHKAIETGNINSPKGGSCMSVPLDRMYMADVVNEFPVTPEEAPAELVRPGEDDKDE